MKKTRFSVEQIVATLKQIELEMTVAAAFRQRRVGASHLPLEESSTADCSRTRFAS